MQTVERRTSRRARLEPLFCNKHIAGTAYLAEVIDVAEDGLLLRTTIEPHAQPESFAIELDVPGNPTKLWLWCTSVRKDGNRQAVKLIGTELFDRACLAQLVRWRSSH